MSWGYYSGKLTDYTTDPIPFTAKPDIFNRARASVIMIGHWWNVRGASPPRNM
jgi:hypothetical protein